MKIVSTTYLAKNRLKVLAYAWKKPVGITRYGVLSFVLMSTTEYERLAGVRVSTLLGREQGDADQE
ncbi:hypothetical protein [Celeribacter sp. SCSIO 80788]|uniref:hypothetical protein n=1 Tax=Celeribacter sp. SCSIO 80788 TaxID=3117013 RepID=UPI003DA41EC4